MSKWLTTGEMIDKLKLGKVAECVDGENTGAKVYYNVATLTLLIFNSKTEQEKIFNVKEYHKSSKWRILPNYVSFVKAMKELEYGHTVTFHDEDGSTISFNEADLLNTTLDKFLPLRTWSAFTKGKWTIENV